MMGQCEIYDITSCQYWFSSETLTQETFNTARSAMNVRFSQISSCSDHSKLKQSSRVRRQLISDSRVLSFLLSLVMLLYSHRRQSPAPPTTPASTLPISADASSSKIHQQLRLICSYNMAGSDHWVLHQFRILRVRFCLVEVSGVLNTQPS